MGGGTLAAEPTDTLADGRRGGAEEELSPLAQDDGGGDSERATQGAIAIATTPTAWDRTAWFPFGGGSSDAPQRSSSSSSSAAQPVPGLGTRTISDASSTVSSRTATGPTSIPIATALSSSYPRFAAAAGLDSYAPALPSPLSTCHTPETLAIEDDDRPWMHAAGSARSPSGSRGGGGGGGFPFPASPTPASRVPSQGSWSSCSSRLSQHSSPPEDLLLLHDEPIHHDHLPPPPTSLIVRDHGRSQSDDVATGTSPAKPGLVGPPLASKHWRATSSSASNFSRRSLSPSRSSSGSLLLTPPESTKVLPTSADLAWTDLGLGGIGGGSAFGMPYSATLLEISGMSSGGAADGGSGAKSTVVDLMSLDNNEVISDLIGNVPLPEGDGVINIVEFGALNSRSASIIAPIISHLAVRQATSRKEQGLPISDDESVSFQVTHTDKVLSDFRPLIQQLESHSDSYLSSTWQAHHRPSLDGKVFSSFAGRPFGAKVLPKASVSVGFSAMSLHWLSTDRKYRSSPATIAHGELMAFLSARATEFKPGGLFAMAYISRSEEEAPPSSSQPPLARSIHPGLTKTHSDGDSTKLPTEGRPLVRERSASSPVIPSVGRRDIWTVLTGILGKALQRLVSTQLLKPAVARQLLALPIHPRTAKQTHAVLASMQHAWTVETEERVVLSHPAMRGLEHSTVSAASYADHTIQLLKIFFESEMRAILREALLSRAACEWILESLFDIAKEKVEEEGPQPLELEVQIVALRRRADKDV
ncbi:hypothetical protein RQP46_005740 [Phenoliferia psychrophenolica]